MALLLAGSTTKAVRIEKKWNYSRVNDPNQEGLPWAHNQFHENNESEVMSHVKAFGDAARGEKCFGKPCKGSLVQLDESTADEKKWNYSRNRYRFEEENKNEVDDHVKAFGDARRGEKCFGKPCKDSLLQLEESQPYGTFEAERDDAAGYPKTIAQAGLRKIMKDYVGKNGEHKT